MKFVISGANKETGEDVQLTVMAADTRQAEAIAREKGIMVSAIKQQVMEHDFSPIAMDDDDATPSSAPKDANVDPAYKAAMAAKAAAAAAAAAAAPPPLPAQAPAPHANHPEGHTEAHADDHRIHHTGHAQYKVLINPNLMLLMISVNNALKQGWELQGGVGTCVINNANNYLQAIVHWPEEGAAV